MQQKKVIALVGMPGAGKSYCVEHLEKKGWPSVYFGGVVVDEVKRRGMEVNEVNEKFVREDLRAKEGNGAIAERMIGSIEKLFSEGHDIVIADGIYSWSEYKIFKEIFGKRVLIIAITAPRHIRHERLANRPVRPFTEAEATAREYAEIENIEKGGPIANADYTVVNEKTPEDMLANLDRIIEEAL